MEIPQSNNPARSIGGEHVERSSESDKHLTNGAGDLSEREMLLLLDFEAVKSALVIELRFLAIPISLGEVLIFLGSTYQRMTCHVIICFRVSDLAAPTALFSEPS